MYSSFLRNSTRLLIKPLRTNNVMASFSSAAQVPSYETLAVSVPKPYVYHVELNRPKKLNAFNRVLWSELGVCFNELSNNSDCRVIVLSGSGKHFTAGIDLQDMVSLGSEIGDLDDIARKTRLMEQKIKAYQDSISSLETCNKPVVALIHAACVGAGVDLITATDIRYCTNDAWFQVKEVDIGMAADVGTLQRLPKIIGSQSLVRELCYTGRKILSHEAHTSGLVSRVFETKDSMMTDGIALAEEIASKSPVAVQASKKNLVYSLDHTNQEGLDQIRLMNSTLLQSEDFINACVAQATKGDKPVFSKL